MKALIDSINECPEIEVLKKSNDGTVHLWGASRNARPLIMEDVRGKSNIILIVTHDDYQAEKLYSDYQFFDKDVYLFPTKDVLFYYADVHGNAISKKRLDVIKRIAEGERTVIITTICGLMDKLPKIDTVLSEVMRIKSTDSIDVTGLTKKLSSLGYEHVNLVDTEGQFCVRGGIIDIFPITEECPYRIELWGDDIDSIRYFDPESQRSIDEADEIVIYPASEMVLTEERYYQGLAKIDEEHKRCAKVFKESFCTEQYARLNKYVSEIKEELENYSSAMGVDNLFAYFYDDTVSFMEYLPEDAKIFVNEPAKVYERAKSYYAEFNMAMQARIEGGYILPGQADVLYDGELITTKISMRNPLLFSELYTPQKAFLEKKEIKLVTRELLTYSNNFMNFISDITKWRKSEYKIIVVCPTETRAKKLSDNINGENVPAFYTNNKDRHIISREVMVVVGKLETGFEIPSCGLVVISENEIFSQTKNKKKKLPKYEGSSINSLDDISVGDYVVHEDYGIGIYKGIEQIVHEGRCADYITIEYGDGGILSVPVEQLAYVGKYSGKEDARPKLNKLGGTEWSKARSKVRGRVDEIAQELVDLYAARQSKIGFSYSEDSVWQREFEDMFPFEETPDQLKAIEDTKRDMEDGKIMDRLICGDVGFGKTEVALRAAFKAVQDSRQVAYLVPTTILAQQHYETFVSRMRDYPIKIKLLSRFCTPGDIKDTLKGLNNGSVDIVIGTQRLLSKDVNFKELGLLIIDEEQRFGVKHKEKIKQMKNDINVLTLTATPIPRTLHMSLIGLRDMSLLEEPPVDRRAIQTYVMEYDIMFVKEAINRELARQGQVYYVYNKIDDIEKIVFELKQYLPDARICFAHGRMNEKELENIMKNFIVGEIDVLVSTTIIETGLDIPNVNTIIIHDADKFGLSQLYQLRGRVGRSSRNAYAYLMYRKDKMIKEVAEKRLKAIRDFTDLGSGYKIAMKDLEIRGAGNLLGSVQSGHIDTVGYDLYCKMLNEAIKRQAGEVVEEKKATVIDLPVDAFIPDEFVRNEFLKLELYKRISRFESMEDYDAVVMEVEDRFGKLPKPFERLLFVAILKLDAAACGITAIKYVDSEVHFVVGNPEKIDVSKVTKFVKSYKGKVRLVNGANQGFAVKISKLIQDDMLSEVAQFLKDFDEKLIIKEENN